MLKPHDIQKLSERQREVIVLEAKAVLVWVLVPVSSAARVLIDSFLVGLQPHL